MSTRFLCSLSPHSKLEGRNSPHFADEGNFSFEKLSNLVRITLLANDDPRAGSQSALAPALCAHPGCLIISWEGQCHIQPRVCSYEHQSTGGLELSMVLNIFLN